MNRQMMQAIQTSSRIVTLIFLGALIWAVYQAAVNRNPPPVWAWIGVVALLSAAIGLAVAGVVYRGVAKEAGPFAFRTSTRVLGELNHEVQSVPAAGASSLRAEIKMTQGVLRLAGGAAEAGLDLTRLRVESGVGELVLNLSGDTYINALYGKIPANLAAAA